MPVGRLWFIGLSVALLSAGPGCQSSSVSDSPPWLSDGTFDPQAEQMHEMCGIILIFYMRNERLPRDWQELKDSSDTGPANLDEPGYIYLPDTPPIPGRPGYLLLVNPEQSSSRKHWAIIVQSHPGSGPLTLQVVQIDAQNLASVLATQP